HAHGAAPRRSHRRASRRAAAERLRGRRPQPQVARGRRPARGEGSAHRLGEGRQPTRRRRAHHRLQGRRAELPRARQERRARDRPRQGQGRRRQEAEQGQEGRAEEERQAEEEVISAHLLLLGAWAGLVASELIMEAVCCDDASARQAAVIHFWLDVLLEVPLVLGIVATGAVLLARAWPPSGVLLAKLALAATAIGCNL